jgi:hypothetical protein
MGDYYQNIGLAEQPVTNYERFQAKKEAEEAMGPDAVLKGLEASASSVMTPFAAKRAWDRRSSQFEDDPTWEFTEELRTDLMHEYNKHEMEELESAGSESEFLAKKRYIQEDRDRLYAKSALGLKGAVSDIAFSMLDPVSIALGFATGGIGLGVKATGIAKAARVAAIAGTENAVLEAMLAQGDTQHEVMDTVTAFAGGAFIGAAVSPFVRARGGRRVDLADEMDDAIRLDAENFVTKEILDNTPRPKTDLDTYKIQRHVSTRDIELNRAYDAGSAWDNARFGEAKRRIKQIDKELEIDGMREESPNLHQERVREEQRSFIEKAVPERQRIKEQYREAITKQQEKIAKIEKKLAQKDTPKQQAKLWKEELKLKEMQAEMTSKISQLESKLKAKIHKAEWKLKKAMNQKAKRSVDLRNTLLRERLQLQEGMDLAIKSRRAGKELKAWNNMTQGQKIQHVFGDELPTITGEMQRQAKGRVDLNSEATVKIDETIGIDDEGIITDTKTAPLGSAGAAAAGFRPLHRLYDIAAPTKVSIARFAHDGANVPKALEGWSLLPKFTKMAHSAFTRLSKSDNFVIRGLNYHLLSAGQGGPANPAGAAAVWSDIYSKQFRSAVRNRLSDGMEMYRKSNGIGKMQMLFKPEVTHQFYKDVIMEVKYPGSIADEGVKLAAEGCADLFETAGKSMKAKGVKGFENLELDRTYFSTIVDENRIATMCREHGKSKVEALLSDAYQRGEYELPKQTADYVARGYIARSLDHTLKMNEFPTKVRNVDIDRMVQGLKDAKVPDDVIESFISEAAESNLTQGMSNRAKKSLKPDLQTELNGLKMIDMVESDVPKLLESYTREAAGSSAMAKLGFKTRREAKEFLAEVKKDAYNLGHNKAEVDQEIQILSDCIDMIYGRSIEKNPGSGFIRNLSRVRDFTALIRLQSMGLSTIPEIARVTAKRGLSTVLEGIPEVGVFGTKGIRAGKKWSGELTNPKLREMEEMFYITGEDHILYPGYLRIDNIEESAVYKSLGSYVDNCLARGRKFQEVVSAFRYMQGSSERLSLNALANKMKRWADDEIDLNKFLNEADINDAGWHDGFLDQVKEWMQANPKTEMNGNQEVRLFNAGKMPLEMRERLVLGLHQLTMRDMQRPMIGELPTWMNKWFGATMTQFRNFSLLSLNKQLIHDIRHDQMAGAIITMHSLFLSYIAYSLKASLSGVGRKDQDAYFKQAFSQTGIMFGMLNNMGQLASVGIAGDVLATLGALPSDWMAAPGKRGFRSMTAGSVPIVGAGSDVLNLAKDAVDIAKLDANPSKVLKDVQRVAPFGKAIGINQAINAISGALDE